MTKRLRTEKSPEQNPKKTFVFDECVEAKPQKNVCKTPEKRLQNPRKTFAKQLKNVCKTFATPRGNVCCVANVVKN